jgi:hypothetical protein
VKEGYAQLARGSHFDGGDDWMLAWCVDGRGGGPAPAQQSSDPLRTATPDRAGSVEDQSEGLKKIRLYRRHIDDPWSTCRSSSPAEHFQQR